jgi:hypothetical protein
MKDHDPHVKKPVAPFIVYLFLFFSVWIFWVLARVWRPASRCGIFYLEQHYRHFGPDRICRRNPLSRIYPAKIAGTDEFLGGELDLIDIIFIDPLSRVDFAAFDDRANRRFSFYFRVYNGVAIEILQVPLGAHRCAQLE